MSSSTGASSAVSAQQSKPFFRWIFIAFLVVVLDQYTKWLILQNYEWGQYTPITSFFNIVRAHNPGAAFSFLAGHDGWQRWFFIVVGIIASIFITWQLRSHGEQKLASLSFALILGGAIGNVVDRFVHGYVVDFLDFYWGASHFPSFNLADTAITTGVIGMLLAELIRWKKEG